MEPLFPHTDPPRGPRDEVSYLPLIVVVAWFTFIACLLAVGIVLGTREIRKEQPGQTVGGCERTAPPWRSAECAARK